MCESETAVRYRMGDLRPGRGLFRDHHDIRIILRHDGIQVSDKIDSFQIVCSAINIRDVFGSSVITVEHTRYRIHTDTVEMEFLDPEHGIGDQE